MNAPKHLLRRKKIFPLHHRRRTLVQFQGNCHRVAVKNMQILNQPAQVNISRSQRTEDGAIRIPVKLNRPQGQGQPPEKR